MLYLVRGRGFLFGTAALLGALSAALAFGPYLAVWLIVMQLLDQAPDLRPILFVAAVLAVVIVMRHAIFAASTTIAHIAAFDMEVCLRREILGESRYGALASSTTISPSLGTRGECMSYTPGPISFG